MAGHSHWAGIKHHKETTDKKRGVVFSRLLSAITAAAKSEPNPDFNPRLRTAVEKARENNVPKGNIERAIGRARESGGLEELLFEAYGPGGAAILIESISDNKNRAAQEVKKILSDFGGKWAESGSCAWTFAKNENSGFYEPKFKRGLGSKEKEGLVALVSALEGSADVQKVYTNAEL